MRLALSMIAIAMLQPALAKDSAYTPPRLDDGRPNLQGHWVDAIFEDACHEGNYSLRHILEAGRVRDGQLR